MPMVMCETLSDQHAVKRCLSGCDVDLSVPGKVGQLGAKDQAGRDERQAHNGKSPNQESGKRKGGPASPNHKDKVAVTAP